MVLENYQLDLELFRKHVYRSKRLKPYYSQYQNDMLTEMADPNVKDALLAQGYDIEDAPRSVYRVSKLFEALSHYAPGKNPSLKIDDNVAAGIALAYKCFARKNNLSYLKILPMSAETVVRVTSNPSGSPGLTNYGCTKAESMTRALERGLQILSGEKQPEPCLAFKRTQFNDKTRLVWGYPYSMTVIEGLVAKPLLDKFKGGNTPMAFAMTTGALGTKLRVASYHREWAYSLDMSQFDATISSSLIHIAFKIIRTWFDMDAMEPVSGKTVKNVFDIIEKYFIHTTIVMPDGNIYYGKDHGVPSGSYFTQMVDSIVNTIIGGTISARFALNVDRHEIFVLGDDLLMWSNRRIDLDKIAKYANQIFGVKLHGKEKSEIYHYDDVVHYLGRDWANGMPTLSEEEVIKRMVFPESFRRYDKDPKLRTRQLHMMLLAYAATYRSAWRIAYRILDPSDANYHRGCANTDVNTYMYDGRKVELQPEFMSGLQRYLFRFRESDGNDIPNTALQYWL